MKARPILFSAPMVRALLSGRKTMTRRVVKLPHEIADWQYIQPMHGTSPDGNQFGNWQQWRIVGPDYPDDKDDDIFCPYGQPGDLLWVKETQYITPVGLDYVATSGHYEAGGECLKKPSIFMRKTESRITLKITDIRVERLQDISEDDAAAEGIKRTHAGGEWGEEGLIEDFETLWESINGPGSWDENPFVWCLSFEVIKKNIIEYMTSLGDNG